MLPLDYRAHSRLLRHAEGYSRGILTQNLQRCETWIKQIIFYLNHIENQLLRIIQVLKFRIYYSNRLSQPDSQVGPSHVDQHLTCTWKTHNYKRNFFAHCQDYWSYTCTSYCQSVASVY